MFEKFGVVLKKLKDEVSRTKKLQIENDLLKAKLKLTEEITRKAFVDGNAQVWSLVQVVIYDMYKNMEILDYGTFISAIAKNLTEYNSNASLRDEKINQYNADVNLRKQLRAGAGGYANFN